MKNNLLIDIIACYKSIDENNVSAILEIKRKDSADFEMIFKYTFSIDKLEKNSIEVYKDLSIPELYDLYILSYNNPNYKGIFDIYFRVYQNELNELRSFAKEKLYEVNNPSEINEESILDQVKDGTKKLLREIWEEGSSNELNGTITKVAAYKKLSIDINKYAIDILRYRINSWETIYCYEYGKHKVGGLYIDISNVSSYKILSTEEIFKIISLLDTVEEYDVMKSYLKTTPKEVEGNVINEDKPKIENIKFL